MDPILAQLSTTLPAAQSIGQLTRPLLAPIRRIVPTVSGVDLSPLVAILLLQVVLMFL